MQHHAKPERSLFAKAALSIPFAIFCMMTVQIPLIHLLLPFTTSAIAFSIAYISGGVVVFLFNYFIAHGKIGLSWDHFRAPDWPDFRTSLLKHAINSALSSMINAGVLTMLLSLGPTDRQWLLVLIANMASGAFGQTMNLLVVYKRPPKPKHRAR